MSSIIIKSLLVPENNQVSSVSLKPLHLSPETAQPKEQSGLSRLDSLKLSNFQGSKGHVPVNLLDPSEIKPLNNSKGNGAQGTRLASLQQFSKNQEPAAYNYQGNSIPVNANNQTLRPLSTGTKTSKAIDQYLDNKYGAVNQSPKVQLNNKSTTSVAAYIDFIETKDITDVKLNNAIDKISVWGMKVGNLKSLVDAQSKSSSVGVAAGNIIIATSTQVAKARTEAEVSRNDAIHAYNEALSALKKDLMNTGINRNSIAFTRYDQTYNQMEKLYEETKKNHESIWQSTKSFLWNNLQVAIDSYL